jgi:membrane-bound ClpP family serine protease
MAVGFFSARDHYSKELPKLIDNSGFMLLGGMFSLIIGFFIIEYHTIWEQNWKGLITLIGWAALIKGVMLLAFPGWFEKFKPWYKKENLRKWGYIVLIVGLFFGYYGFMT